MAVNDNNSGVNSTYVPGLKFVNMASSLFDPGLFSPEKKTWCSGDVMTLAMNKTPVENLDGWSVYANLSSAKYQKTKQIRADPGVLRRNDQRRLSLQSGRQGSIREASFL